MTCDTLWGVNILSKFQLPSSYGFGLTGLEDSEQKDDSIDESVNESVTYKGDCQTALATLGMLIILN